MSAEENKAIVRRSFEDLLNQGDRNVADEVYAPDFLGHDPAMPEEMRGPEDAKQFVSFYRSAFPDIHVTIEDQVAEGDRVVTRFTTRGTHQGELMGIPPSGKRVEMSGMTMNRVSGGKIAEEWDNYDALGMMQQIGAIPEQEEQASS